MPVFEPLPVNLFDWVKATYHPSEQDELAPHLPELLCKEKQLIARKRENEC